MKNTRYLMYLLPPVLALGVASCKVTKTYKRPEISADQRYRDQTGSDTSNIATLSWKTMFTDTVLQKLITEGIAHNLDLQIAVTSMEQAAATFKQSKAAFLPSLSVDADVTQAKLSGIQGYNAVSGYRQYQLEASSSWEADIWGKLKSSKKAAYASLLASDAYRRVVLTQLIADIANNYYALLAYDRQLAITEQTVKNRNEDVLIVQKLKASDVVNGLDVMQSQSNKYAASVSIPDIKLNIRETENALCVLLGRESGEIERKTLDEQQTASTLSTGIPAQLLANRPDVQQAEYNLQNAFENTNVSRTAFYPSLSLTAAGGLSSTSLNNFFKSTSLFGNVVAGLTQPIFNKGANKAQLRISEAQQQSALLSFRKSLLTAGQEVSNALFSYQMARQKAGDRSNQIQTLEKAVNYSKQLLKYTSATNYTDVLTAEQNLLSPQLNSVSDRLQEMQAVVNLYRALGGGWQ